MTGSYTIKVESSTLVDGLPKSFVDSMRTLFDIMDDQKTGFIKFTEIERRWKDDGTQGLPKGVLDSIRKVTPPDGNLSFERFCAALKMCLLKSKPHDGIAPYMPSKIEASTRPSGAASPANSLDTVPPFVCSSPQISPHSKSRPLSAPILDQHVFKKVLSNNNYLTSLNGNNGTARSTTAHTHSHYNNNGYIYSNQPQKLPSTQQNSNTDSKTYGTKSDIRMGIGGIKAHGKGPPPPRHVAQNIQGPPKPPRSIEYDKGTQSLDRNLDNRQTSSEKDTFPENTRMTHSLERESRSLDKKTQRDKDDNNANIIMRRERGGSLERLLDADGPYSSKISATNPPPPPPNRTGMRSAIQTWFREKSKSDLHDVHMKMYANRHQNRLKSQYTDNTLKEQRNTGSSQPMEPTTRSAGDGGNGYRNTISRSTYSGPIVPPPSFAPPNNLNQHGAQLPKNNLNEGVYGKSKKSSSKSSTAMLTTYNVPNEPPPPPPHSGATAHGMYVAPQASQVAIHKKTGRKEPRRHTLQNGIDHNEMRRLRQLEAERDMLYQGLDVVERARMWYKQQLHNISERIHYLPLGPTQEPTIEMQREKLNFQLARIHEINAHLRALMEASEKGSIPSHINLAIWGPETASPAKDDSASKRLKNQNKLLTEEVSAKSDRITALEREKSALLRELFQARAATQHSPADDTTFM